MISISNDKNMMKLIEIEKKSLKSMLDIQKNLNKQILSFLKNFLGDVKIDLNFDSENTVFKYIKETTDILGMSNANIEKLDFLLNKLNDIISSINDKYVKEKIELYNSKFESEIDTIYEHTTSIEKFIHKISLLDLSQVLAEINKVTDADTNNEDSDLEISSETLNSTFVENTLVISEMKGKVILPYKISKVNDILFNDNDKYSSIEDVIEKIYTKPIKEYRFSAIARFREAYKLVIEKEHKSKMKAFSLASELFANYNLHPAIITACKSLDELDIYLACLEDNSLDDFPFFDVKYEVAPKIQKQELQKQEIPF